MAEICERLPGEPTAAFTAFQKYRDMEADASYAKVARMLGKSKSLIGRWARQWRWLEPRAPGQTLNILSGNSFRVSTRRTLLGDSTPQYPSRVRLDHGVHASNELFPLFHL